MGADSLRGNAGPGDTRDGGPDADALNGTIPAAHGCETVIGVP